MSPPEPKSRRGVETIRRYGADFIASRAREGLIRKRLEADGLDPEKMKPDDLAAYRKEVFNRQAALMRAAQAMKHAVVRAEREAEAAVQAAEAAKAKAEAARAALEAKDGGA